MQSYAAYTEGVVAMAKTQNEAPGTAGSQFFVVTGEDIGLPPEYAIVGRVTEGMDTVEAIDALGVGDGPPSKPVTFPPGWAWLWTNPFATGSSTWMKTIGTVDVAAIAARSV